MDTVVSPVNNPTAYQSIMRSSEIEDEEILFLSKLPTNS